MYRIFFCIIFLHICLSLNAVKPTKESDLDILAEESLKEEKQQTFRQLVINLKKSHKKTYLKWIIIHNIKTFIEQNKNDIDINEFIQFPQSRSALIHVSLSPISNTDLYEFVVENGGDNTLTNDKGKTAQQLYHELMKRKQTVRKKKK